jgi:DNA-directed RNA polymerases I, II, and III subunit RPABC1
MSSANYQTEKSAQDVTKIVITNIIKMLMYRKWVNGKIGAETIANDLLNSRKEEKIYNLKLSENLSNVDTYEPFDNKKEDSKWKDFNGNNVVIFLSKLKVSSGKAPSLNEFINKYQNFHKIIVVDSITDKIRQSMTSGKLIEIFSEYELMMNLSDHVCCPKYQVLKNTVDVDNDEEVTSFLKSYNVKRNELQKQLDTDTATRYLFLRRGQVVRVVRNSATTAESVTYRIIIHKGSSAK